MKYDAPQLLRKALASESWDPEPIVMSGVTDPYQPVERELRITRGCLEVLADCYNPVVIITKNHLVTRDADLLATLARKRAAKVVLSITSLRNEITASMEPRTSRPAKRLSAVKELTEAGVPVHVNIAPIVPGLTEDEMVLIMEAAREAGAESVSYTILRLPYGVKDLFAKWLEDHHPDRKKKVLNRIRSLKGGKLNRSEFGTRFRGDGPFGDQIRSLMEIHSARLGFLNDRTRLSCAHFRRPETDQLRLF